LTDVNWNGRHHENPSKFNSTNHPYYRSYFEKPFRQKQTVVLTPQKQLDPYEENDVKGTRMPDYSTLAGERDVFGELGWIPNFEIKRSKNNNNRHVAYREMFDAP